MKVDRLFLVQHGLTKSSGHWLAETLHWQKAAGELFLPCLTFVHKDLPQEIASAHNMHRVFGCKPYDITDAAPHINKLASFIELSDIIRNSLSRSIPADCSSRDLLLMAYTTHVEIFGVAKWLESIPLERRPRIAFMFHQVDLLWEVDPVRLSLSGDHSMWEYAVRALSQRVPASHVRFFAAGAALTQVLSAILKVRVHPTQLVIETPEQQAEKIYDLGILGGARTEQGSLLWPDIISALLKQRPNFTALIQMKDEEEAQKMRQLAASYPNAQVDVIAGYLPAEEHKNKLMQIRLLLLAYMPKRYCLRNSGVFCEAMCLGIPAAVSRYTSMAKQIEAGKAAGTLFNFGDTHSTADAIIDGLRNNDALTQQAKGLMKEAKQQHAAHTILSTILSSFGALQ